ncbi:MAG: zinc-ribbon domain-containing protein [Bacteroidota bacterium]
MDAPLERPASPPERTVQYCGQCGAENPLSGRFCTMCGAPLAEGVVRFVAPPSGPPSAATKPAGSKKLLVMVGAVAAFALVLFAVDRLSGTPESPVETEAPPATASGAAGTPPPAAPAPVTADPQTETRAAQIEADIAAAETEAGRIGKRIELVETYARAGLYGRAAEAQSALAEVTQTAAAWATVGTLWLDHIPQVGADEQAPVALSAIDAYQQSLAIEDDPDVRVNLALAYQYDPSTPMGTVEQLQTVIEGYPDHPEANFNMGLMRARIGRLDQAIESMERVIAVTDHDNPVHQRAELELAQLRGQAQQQGS